MLQAGTYGRVHRVVAMLQTKILLFSHAQVGVRHVQQRLASVLFLGGKKNRMGRILKQELVVTTSLLPAKGR